MFDRLPPIHIVGGCSKSGGSAKVSSCDLLVETWSCSQPTAAGRRGKKYELLLSQFQHDDDSRSKS